MKRFACLDGKVFRAVLLVAALCLALSAFGHEVAAEVPPAKEFRGRLPDYFGQVVDQGQREAIYAIQADYAPKIADLKAKLEALTAERDEKVAAVLTPEQSKQVEQLRAAAKEKRGAKTE